MARKLRHIKIDEISLVDSPANPLARVVLAKRVLAKADDDETCRLCNMSVAKEDRYCKGCGAPFYKADKEKKAMALDKSKLAPEVAEHISKLEADLAEATKAGEQDDKAGVTSEARALLDKARSETEEARKATQKLLEEAQAETQSAREELAKLQEARRSEEFHKKAEALRFLPGIATKELGAILKDISDKVPETFKKLEIVLKIWNDAIEAGGLFEEKGTTAHGDDVGSASERVLALANAKVEKGVAKDLSSALSLVSRENPGLFREYRKETTVKV